MTSNPSLRDLYNEPSSSWSFVQPVTQSAPTVSPPSNQPPPFQWSTRPQHNSIFDLSPDLNDDSGINATALLRALTASAVLQYTSTAIAMPWEVGKLLLQVQWVPKDALEVPTPEVEEDDDETSSQSSNEHDPYFADPEGTPRVAPPQLDEVRRSLLEEGTRPEYIIPVGSADGVWGMIKRVGSFRAEGWLALWKGSLTACMTEIIFSCVQPAIYNVLKSMLLPPAPFQRRTILIPIASHLLTGFLISPLDLIRTRLIVQSFLPQYRAYSGPFDALRQILRDEGGLKGIYFHPHLLIPTVIDNLLRPVVSLALPGLIVSYLGLHISEDANPLAWGMVELAGSCLGLLVTIPFETVRRRLQVQPRGNAKPIKGCVELRPAPYNGVVDTMWHIVTEERSDLPLIPTQRTRRPSQAGVKGKEREGHPAKAAEDEGWMRNTGIGQLYRGMGMRLGASVIVFMLTLVSGDDSGSGWAEL